MSKPQPPDVGPHVRALREQRGLSMRALAELCDLSPNAISLIERGITSPNVSTLHRLATALQVHIAAFFEPPQESAGLVLSRASDRPTSSHVQTLLESLGSGLTEQIMDPFEVTLKPGAGSGRHVMSHNGQELVYCLQGKLEYTVEGESYLLGAGDALMFEAHRPHSWRNPGPSSARFLIVFGACEDSNSLAQHLQS
jgi:quercetin dioxygenase-like cupin family protein/DNA-binding XRE family transcriptional regulator